MISDVLRSRILRFIGHQPTADQLNAIDTVAAFISDFNTDAAMILSGSAGTGKTTLASAIVRALKSLGQKVVLLAPTGRAAKVFSLNADTPAFTIHRKIYRQKAYTGLDGAFQLGDNMASNTLFLIDEASMAPRELLDDLIRYVYNGSCRMLLIGDKFQLPPVGVSLSPALDKDELICHSLKVYKAELDEVVRQSEESGILFNATMVRRMLQDLGENLQNGQAFLSPEKQGNWKGAGLPMQLPPLKSGRGVKFISGNDLIDALDSSFYRVGIDETMVVTRSNKRAVIYNNGIRARCLDREEELESGDMVMIVKNNYYWTENNNPDRTERADISVTREPTVAGRREKQTGELEGGRPAPTEEIDAGRGGPCVRPPMAFIANGDRALIRRIRNHRELYGFHFCDCDLRFPDYDDYEMTVTVMKDSLQSEAPSLTAEQQEKLYQAVMEDYADIPLKKDRLDALKNDPHYNALQIKFAYASTCHKAQGGQWSHVYIDQGYLTADMIDVDFYRWLYTAITRATERLYFVNWKREIT